MSTPCWTNKPAYEPAPPVDQNPWYDGVMADLGRPSAVYLMESGEAYKVGLAVSVEERRRTLQYGSAQPIVIVAVRPGGRALERAIHASAGSYRRSGEWFTKCDAVMRAFHDTADPDDVLSHVPVDESPGIELPLFDGGPTV